MLLHLATNEIFELNATGYRVWQLIAEGLPRAEIQARLTREFDVAAEQLDREIGELLAELKARQLIVEA